MPLAGTASAFPCMTAFDSERKLDLSTHEVHMLYPNPPHAAPQPSLDLTYSDSISYVQDSAAV